MEPPDPANRFQIDHARLLIDSYRNLTGRELVSPGADVARRLFEAPFFVASHDAATDPILTYGNRTALELFELNWSKFTATPSRLTAEAPLRDERRRLLQRVAKQGYIDDYSGIRISSSGRRFRIERATVWNLIDSHGRIQGQAATFHDWQPAL